MAENKNIQSTPAHTDTQGYGWSASSPTEKYLSDAVKTFTEAASPAVDAVSSPLTLQNFGAKANAVYKGVTDTIVLSLADAWIGLGLIRPASTEGNGWAGLINRPAWAKLNVTATKTGEAIPEPIDRFDYKKLWSLQIGDYFMPLSQTFQLRAKKRLNVSSLVDGIDIIQQTRKEAKTVDVSLRLTLRNNQPNLEIMKDTLISRDRASFRRLNESNLQLGTVDGLDTGVNENAEAAEEALNMLTEFLTEFYENDRVFAINNKMINETFGINYVFITDYRFTPRVGMGTFNIDFSLTEVIYGDDVLTFDARQMRN